MAKDISEFNPEVWQKVADNVDTFLFQFQSLEVTNADTFAQASDVVAACKQHIKSVVAKRKSYTDGIDQTKKLLMDQEHTICRPLQEFIDNLDRQMKDYHFAAQKRAAEEQARLDREALAKAKAEHKSEVEVAVVAPPPKTVRSDFSTTTIVDKWVGEIVDMALVPAQYCSPDPKKIKAAIDGGARSIPGVRIWNDGKLTSR